MSYTALYRKFRPQTFSTVIGQEHIVRTLKNQMRTGRVSHAYLFCGTRGTGKTSTAKIFARAINCTDLQEDGEPCNHCAVCRDILQGRSMNVIEIDAASNNSVDNIREIREEVKYPPTEGHFKVYIIDEVHMLSGSAFNALLKTLEDPPAHVIFILATTDPQKLPATILSRCQRFDFHRITTDAIADTLAGYLAEEGFTATKEALRYVARLGDGSMRDSLSILDQCLAFFDGGEITIEKVLDIVGAVDQSVFFEMTEALSRRDAKKAMLLVEDMMEKGRDVKQFLTEFLAHLRNLLMTAALPDPSGVLDLSAEDAEAFRKEAGLLSPEEIVYFIQHFSDLQSDLKYASGERILLEVELMKLCSGKPEKNMSALLARVGELERKVKEGITVTAVPAEAGEAPKEAPKPKRKPPALPEDKKKVIDQWAMLRNETEDVVLRGILNHISLGFKEGEDEFLYLICDYPALMDIAKKSLSDIETILENASGKTFDLKFTTKDAYDAWYESNYGKPEESSEEDEAFWQFAENYLPDADFEE